MSPKVWPSMVVFLGLFLGGVPFLCAAEGTRVIRCDLQACIELALAGHPMLQASEARQAAARAEIDVRAGAFRPTLDLEAETGYLTGEALTPFAAISGITEEGERQRSVSGKFYRGTVGVDIPLVKEGTLLGWRSSSVRQARLHVAEEDWRTKFLRLQLAMKVAEAYIQVLKQQRAIKTYETVAASFQAGYQLALTRYQQNLIAHNDLLIAEVRFATAKRDLALAQLTLQKSQKALGLAMGLDHGHDIEIQELQGTPPPLLPLEQLLPLATESHPELKAQHFKVQSSAVEVARVQSERYPTLSLTARYGVVDDFSARVNDQFLTSLKVRLPLFDFGLTKHKAEVARAKFAEEERRLQDFQRHLEHDISALYAHVEELTAQIELLKKQIEQAMEALKLNRAMYQQELLPLSSVLEAEAASGKLQLALSDAEYDQQLARFQLSLISSTWPIKER